MTVDAAEQGAPTAIRIDSVAIGSARDFTRPGSRSAIDKRALQGTVQVG
ncbi:MOSC domain-containing protein, partial [Xanthomonas oryzae pv. oryzae]